MISHVYFYLTKHIDIILDTVHQQFTDFDRCPGASMEMISL